MTDSSHCSLCGSSTIEEVAGASLCSVCIHCDSPTSDHVPHGENEFVESITSQLGLDHKSFVIQLDSGDGSTLKLFKAKSIPCMGFENKESEVEHAQERHVNTLEGPLDVSYAWDLLREDHEITQGRKADLIIANGVLTQTPNVDILCEAMRLILKDDGMITFEENWIASPQSSCYTGHSLSLMLDNHDLVITDVHQVSENVMQWQVRNKGLYSVSPSVTQAMGEEESAGLTTFDSYKKILENA